VFGSHTGSVFVDFDDAEGKIEQLLGWKLVKAGEV